MNNDKNLHKRFVQLGRKRLKCKNEMLLILPEIFKKKIYLKHAKSIVEYAGKFGDIGKSTVIKRLRLEKKLIGKPNLKNAIKVAGIHKVSLVANLATPETENAYANKIKNMSKSAVAYLAREIRMRNQEESLSTTKNFQFEFEKSTPVVTPATAPAPTITPTTAPTPAIAPATAPTITPAVTPTTAPAVTPTTAPAVTPAVTPTTAPTPTITPAVTPTTAPAPTITPAVTPTTAPAPAITPTATAENLTITLDTETWAIFKKLKEKLSKEKQKNLSDCEAIKVLLTRQSHAENPRPDSPPTENSHPHSFHAENPHLDSPPTENPHPHNPKNDKQRLNKPQNNSPKSVTGDTFKTKSQNKRNETLTKTRIIKTRYIPIALKKRALQETQGRCAYPKCQNTAELLHHRERFCEHRNHNSIIPLCKAHHEFMHNGLIENEFSSPNNWQPQIEETDAKTENYGDHLYQKYRVK